MAAVAALDPKSIYVGRMNEQNSLKTSAPRRHYERLRLLWWWALWLARASRAVVRRSRPATRRLVPPNVVAAAGSPMRALSHVEELRERLLFSPGASRRTWREDSTVRALLLIAVTE